MNINKFNENTVDTSTFIIENVPSDNTCFYKSIINCINNDISLKKQLDNDVRDANNDIDLCKVLQNKIYKWIKNNLSLYLVDFDMTISNLITLSHECTVDEYLDRYKYFAGDDSNSNIPDRWGSIVEQVAVSHLYDTQIIVYSPQKYDCKTNKIITGKILNNKPEKNVRLRNIQNIGIDIYKNKIFLLWKKYNKQGHYMSLYIRSN